MGVAAGKQIKDALARGYSGERTARTGGPTVTVRRRWQPQRALHGRFFSALGKRNITSFLRMPELKLSEQDAYLLAQIDVICSHDVY